MEKLLKKVQNLDSEERKNLKQYLSESKDGGGHMDWMYKGDKPDQEEYLLGKKIDKYVEGDASDQDNAGAEDTAFAEVIKRRADIDMQAKMREDPLYMIKKREEESRKRLVENPVKMKQLQKMLEEKQGSKKKKKKSKKKKHKKDSSDSGDSDDELLNKYLAIVKQKESAKQSSQSRSSHTSEISSHNRRERDSKHDHRDRHSLKYKSEHRQKSPSKIVKHEEKRYHSKHKSKSYHGDSDDRETKPHRYSPEPRKSTNEEQGAKKYGLIGGDLKRRSRTSPKRQRSRSPVPSSSKQRTRSPPRRKLTKEEMEQRRLEMMDNARSREKQREQNVKTYKAEAKREEQAMEEVQSKGRSSDFINPMMAKHVDESSVQDRIKRNIYKVQRTSASLDKKFTQK